MKRSQELTQDAEQVSRLSLADLKQRSRRIGRQGFKRASPVVPQERGSIVPLSYAQERLWFLDQLGLVGSAYNMPMAFSVRGPLNVSALQRSLTQIIERHEVLRTRFESVEGSGGQIIGDPGPLAWSEQDLSALPEMHRGERSLQLCAEEAARPFDLSKDPALRILLIKMAQQEHVLMLNMHHIVADGWSLGLLHRELGNLYAMHANGSPRALPELPVQYADYAIWQRKWLQEGQMEEQLQYWREQLAVAPAQLQLPTDRPRPNIESFRGDKLRFQLPNSLCTALKELATREGVTMFMLVLAVYQVLLSRWSGEEDILVGTPIAGRRAEEIENLIGFFVNTLVLRTQVTADLPFREFLKRVKEITLDAYAHQDVPFEALVKELRPNRNLARQPVFQVLLALQNYPDEELRLEGLSCARLPLASAAAHFDLTLYLYETKQGMDGIFEYATDLFDAATIERMTGHLRVLFEAVLKHPDCAVGDLPLITKVERHRLSQLHAATEAAYPREKCVHQLFEEQATLTPDAIAVAHHDRKLTYAELDAKANQVARALWMRDAKPDALVAVCMERGLEMIVGVLGILKAGAAYLPLDPNYPSDRLEDMLKDAAPRVLLTQDKLIGVLPNTTAEVLTMDGLLEAEKDRRFTPRQVPQPQNLVYVIYTSGSTGRPKGTEMPHAAMVNLIDWHRRTFAHRGRQRVLQFAALGFDVAFQEIFTTLCTGDTLVLLDEWMRRDVQALCELLRLHAIQRLFVPPLMLQALAEYCRTTNVLPAQLQDVICAGEQLRINADIVEFFRMLPGCRLHNHYGPTETHVVTALTLDADPSAWPELPTIGFPIANTQIHILDGRRQWVPTGVIGEIYIGGAGVARGYLCRPELTCERFIKDDFGAEPGARLYKTGDLGRRRQDGTIEYLGRNDHQIKLRGYRIEMGEIEAQLKDHEEIKDTIVAVREDASGQKRLIAYFTSRSRGGPSVEALRTHLKDRLPEYMVPSAFVGLECFPVTPSGKLDRRSLPAPDISAYATMCYEEPEGEIEQALAEIWKALLNVERVGRADNFFELGGHSLHGLKLVARVSERFGIHLSGIAMFQYPTIRQMAHAVESLRSKKPGINSAVAEFDEGTL